MQGNTTETGSGVSYWQYSYSNSASTTGTDANSSWVTYNNSASTSVIFDPFTGERNQPVYIRVCDNVGNCSTNSTYIRIGTYTVSYDANGGSGAPSSQTKYYATDLTLSSTVPTRSGYTFLGWSTSSTATSATYKAGGTYTNNVDITLYAVWTTGPTYTSVEYKNITSTGYDVYVYGVTDPQGINYLRFPTWTNANGQDDIIWGTGTNLGSGTWYYRVNTSNHNTEFGTYYTHIYALDNSGNQEYVTGSTITVPSTTTYTLTYDNNGGSGCTSKKVMYGSQIGTLCTPTRSGYTFVGWFDSTYKDNPLNYYADTNSDLKTTFGYDETSLWNHYNNYGKSEGRRISQYISTDVYSSTSNKTIYAGWISSYSNTWVSGKSDCFDVSPSTVEPSSFWIVNLNVCWSETYNAYTNASKVSITGINASLSDYYGYTFYLGGGEGDSTRGIYVNGSLLTTMSYHTGGYSVYFGATSTYYAVSGTFPMTSGEIAHSSDGTLTVPIRVYLAAVRSGYTTGYYSSFDSTVNVTLTDTR